MTYISYFRDYLENEGKRRAEVATKGPRKEMCFAKGKGVEGGFARRPLPFTIHSRTVNDVPVTGKFMQDFKVVVTGPAGEVPAELKNNQDGTFFCKYIAPVSGDYKVAIDLLGNEKKGESHGPIKGSVYSLVVREPSDPTKSWAEGPGLERTIEGRPALFTIHAIDKFGKGVPGDNVKVEVKLIEKAPDAPGGTGDVPAEVKDNGDGTYSARYDPKVPGKYRVDVTINDERIRDMPKDVICGRAVDASKSTAQGPGVTPGEPRVGLDAPFTVIARDKLGNKIPSGGSEVKVTITGPSGPVECDVKDDNSGVYQCNYVPPVPGDYVVDVKLEGQGVKDNPFRLNIKKPADPSKSYAEGPGLEHAFDNRPAKFKVYALDEDGKPVSGEPVAVTVKPKGGGDPKDVQITDNGDGTYDVAYIADKPGDYIIDTQIRGESIKDMPKQVHCYPGVDASKTIVEGPGVTGGFAERPLPFVIKSMDKEGKPVTVGGDDYKVQVTGPDGAPVPVDLKDNGDGTYNGVYTPKKPGDYKVMINVNRQKAPVGKSPYTAKVRPGASPLQSFAVGRGWQESYDCLPAKFTIHAKDIDGKPVPGEIVKVVMKNVTTPQTKAKLQKEIEEMDEYLRNRKVNKAKKLEAERKKRAEDSKREAEAKGESLPEIRIEAGGDVPVEVRDNGDGTYLAEYTAVEPGTYQIAVQVGPSAEHIKESPKTIPVHLAKPTVVFWKHTHAKQKEDLKELRKRLQDAEALLSKHGLSLDS
jgi:filamin